MWCKSTIRPGIHNCLGKYFRNGWRLGGTDLSGLCLASNHLGSLLVGALKAWLRGVGAQNGPPFSWLRGVGAQNRPPFAWLRGVGAQNRPPFAWLRGVGAQNGPPFAWLRGVGVQNGPPFSWLRGVGAQNRPPFAWLRGARSKTGRLLHRDGVRGPKRAAFFMPTACAAKTAGCFSQFLGARRKRRAVFHSSWVRGENGGGASRRRKVYPAVRSHVTTRGRASNIREAALGESWKTMREPLRA